jgi:membrane dipeptidase
VLDCAQWAHLVSAMPQCGFTREEAGKIVGGDYLRIFPAAVG